MNKSKEYLVRASVVVALLIGMAFPASAANINGGELAGTLVSKELMGLRVNLVVQVNGEAIPVFCGSQLVMVCASAAVGTPIDLATKIQTTGQSKVVAILAIVLEDQP